MKSVEYLNAQSPRYLPARFGIVVTRAVADPAPTVTLQMKVRRAHWSPRDFVHGGAIIVLADTACGYGCLASLPAGASGFFTIESKTSHIGAIQHGVLECTARVLHAGRSTQVWDAEITEIESGKLIALFRCTQLLLYPSASPANPSMENAA